MIGKDGKSIYIGVFATKEEAAEAYNRVALELYGDFAVLNAIPNQVSYQRNTS